MKTNKGAAKVLATPLLQIIKRSRQSTLNFGQRNRRWLALKVQDNIGSLLFWESFLEAFPRRHSKNKKFAQTG